MAQNTLFGLLCVVVHVAAAQLAVSPAFVGQDQEGNLHVNASAGQRVFVNGVDVREMLVAQSSMLATQSSLNAIYSSLLAAQSADLSATKALVADQATLLASVSDELKRVSPFNKLMPLEG